MSIATITHGSLLTETVCRNAEVDKVFETKGLDFLDREKAKRHAQEEAINNLNY